MTPDPRDNGSKDLEQMSRRLLDSHLKVRLAYLFQENPGLIETVDGLAVRIGANREALRSAIADHVALGMLRSFAAGDTTVYSLDRARRNEFQRLLLVAAQERLWETF